MRVNVPKQLRWAVLLLWAAVSAWPVAWAGAASPSRPATQPASRSTVLSSTRPVSLSSTRPAALSALSAADYQRLVNDLADPSMEGRGAGTEGLEKARGYIVRYFRGLGLEGPFDSSFTQPFPLRAGMKVRKQSLSLLDANRRGIFDFRGGEDFSTLGFSPDANFRAGAVWIGYGISNPQASYDSFGPRGAEANALKGKVAVAFRYEPQDEKGKSRWASGRPAGAEWTQAASLLNKAVWAASRGAVALLVVNPPAEGNEPLRGAEETGYRAGVNIPVIHISAEAFQRILAAGSPEADRDAVPTLRKLQEAADRGAEAPRPLGDVLLSGRVSLTPSEITVHNVAGVLHGAGELADQVVIVGAHYDHLGGGMRGDRRVIYPGADDNASGTAGVMLLARLFRDRAAEANAPASRRTILFVTFSAEERGLVGSRYLAGHLDQAGIGPQQVVAMVNLDMIGRLRNDRVSVPGADSATEWRDILKDAAQGAKVKPAPGGSGMGGSDQASFLSVLRVPALQFITGMHADYHRPTDTADKINAPGAVEVLKVASGVVDHLWTRPTRLTFVAAPMATATAGPAAFLGIVPDEPAEGKKGMPILAVSPGSPAGAAGLKAGDVLVRFNGRAIDKFKDLLDALGAAKPGDTAKLTIQRDGKTLEIEAKLGRRG